MYVAQCTYLLLVDNTELCYELTVIILTAYLDHAFREAFTAVRYVLLSSCKTPLPKIYILLDHQNKTYQQCMWRFHLFILKHVNKCYISINASVTTAVKTTWIPLRISMETPPCPTTIYIYSIFTDHSTICTLSVLALSLLKTSFQQDFAIAAYNLSGKKATEIKQ